VLPDIGIYGLGRICSEEFGQSRMCVSDEIVRTFNPPMPLPSYTLGWVQPVLSGLAQGTTNIHFLAIETYAGELARTQHGSLNCASWSTSSQQAEGLIFKTGSSQDGFFARANCSNPARVACCKLITPD
jgi:hypothetical protein